MADHGAFQRHTNTTGDQECHRQRNQRIEGQPLRSQLGQRLLHQPAAVGANHQHLTVGHIDHPQQTVGDGQAERGEQQDRAEGQAHKSLAEKIAQQQAMLDFAQALLGRRANRRVWLMLRIGIRRQQRLGFRVAGVAEQRDGRQPLRGLRAGKL